MAKTYNQIKNSVLGKNYDINSNVKREKEEKTYADIKSDVLSGKYNFSKVKSNLEREIGLGTLGSDITSLNKRLTESATGWQTQETMNGVRSSVESMQGRLKAFKEYERLFGEGDKDTFKDLRSSYTSAMENWDGLIESYGKYDNAETYTKETEALNALFSMSAEDVQAIIAERGDKVKELEKMVDDYNTATGPLGKVYGHTYIGEDGKLYWGIGYDPGKLPPNIINGMFPTADNPIADNPIARENAKNSEEAYNRYLSGILGNEVEGVDVYSDYQTSGRLEGRNEDPVAYALAYLSPEEAQAYINDYYSFKTPEKAEKKKGYASIEDAKKDLEEYKNPVAYTMADGTEITWQGLQRNLELKEMSSVGDVDSENWDKDYKKYVEKGRAMSEETEGGFLDKSYKNHIGYLRNHPEELEKYEIGMDSSGVMIQSILGNNTNYLAAKHMTKEEFNTYSYYLGKGDVEGAEKYLDLLGDSLRAREGKEIAWNTEGFWDSAHLAYRTGIDQFVQGTMNNFSDADYIPYSPTQQASGIVRQEISEEHGDFATGAYDLGVTGANMLPSVLVGTAVSMVAPQVGVPATAAKVGKALSTVASSATMFAGARGNAYQEMLNLGYSKEQASTYGNLVGASEVGLNALLGGISKLGTSVTSKSITKLVSQIDNGFARFAIRWGGSIGSEALEEGLQEVLTPTFKNIAAGYNTGEKVDWGNVMYSALLGGLLGGTFEAGPLATGVSLETRFNNAMGKNIKANERVGDLFNFASQTSEESEAYKTYTQYANKGINAENVSDYKLGNLYSQTRAEAEGIVNSKKSTAEQQAQAKGIIKELDVYSQASPSARTGSAKNFDKKAVKNIYDKETVNALIESGLESAEGTEAYKLATEYKAKVEGGKSLSADEIAKLSDANDAAIRAEENASAVEDLVERGESKDVAELVARKIRGEILTTEEASKVAESDVALQYVAEQSNAENVTEELLEMAKTMPKKDAALFVALYDGKTDMEAYANAFNLAVAKSENNFSQDDIFKSKSVLSNAQVAKIYEDVRVKADKDVEARFDKLVKATADKKFYKGSINESVIDYDNTSTSGKVNWKDLDSRQKKAITFMNGFAKATGINLVWTKDDEKANGKYNRASNTLYLDVYAGIDHADKLADTIIPTASHELTHWLEKKSPELFRKINDLVFSTLYEHDGRTEEKRIKDEMERTGKSEAVVRSEIIARACEEVLSLSEQGKKIFNSLSKSEQKTFVDKIKEIIQDIVDWVSEFLGLYGKDSLHYEARVLHQYQDKLAELVKLWDEALVGAVEVNQALENSGLYGHVDSIGSIDLTELAKAVGINGESLFQYKAMVEDEAIYREMLLKHKDTIGITKADINALFDMIDKAVDIISENVEALDYAWDADIDDRAFNPVKPNSDKLYKVSLDFSTLCRKRLLQQTVQQTLQNALNKQLSKEESIAIRDELMKVQEEGRKIEVACALCYVEAARMKSPEQIKKFLDNREASIREFFANRNGGDIKTKVAEAEMKAREKLKADNPNGYFGKNGEKLDILTAPKSRMLGADAKFVRAEGKKAKTSYELTEHEQAELDAALKMKVTDFTSAKGLESLAKNHPDLFDAFTSFVRNATHSKGIESDVWWRAGDSDSIGDSLIAKMNEENGLRSQSWSDFQVIHLLDYIAATIELSTKGAKRQSYTKVPDYVKLLGNTGDMINLSLIPERVFNGKLAYDGVEGMAFEIAKKLRDEYHATVGTVCIGINDEQIKMLLMDEFIDYVIPYHHSSMSKATRKLMHIPAWNSYEKYQSEKNLDDTEAKAKAKEYGVKLDEENLHKSPKFSEWFNLEEARQIAKMENEHPSNMEEYKKYGKMYGGYKAMQNAANNYLRLCAERGLAPKFSMGTDFTQEVNYWKLLIDRKMVDNITGEVIEQMPIKPIFNEKHVLEILTDELKRYPQVKADQEYAVRKVTEKFLSGEMKVDASTLEAIKKPIDNVTEVNILESSRDDVDLSERDSEYLELAKNPKANEAKLRKLVAEAARKAGYNVRAYHGTSRGGFTSFDTYGYFAKYGLFGNGAYFTESLKIAKEYQNKGKGNNKQVYDVYLKFNNVIDMDKKADISEWKKSTNNQGFDIALREGMSNEEAFRAFEEELEYEEIPRYEAEEIVRTVFEDMGYDGITHMGGGRIYDNERHRVWIAFEPTAIKSADLVTYDDNGNIIPLSQRFNSEKDSILYSERDDIGYHAGDLGKSESLGQQGADRDTGHFGTGTYFVGDKERIKGYNSRNGVPAPQHAVDFSNYNLYKVKNDKDGYDLHRQLRIIDGGIKKEWLEAANKDEFHLYRSTEFYDIAKEKFGEENAYKDKSLIYGLKEMAKKADIEFMTEKQYSEYSGYALTDEYFEMDYLDYLKEEVKGKVEDINDKYEEFRDAYFYLRLRFGLDGRVYEAMNKVLAYQDANDRSRSDAYEKDSLATVFMKSLGYEGVDTRGTALDNTAYGSVIYDLKEDSVLYSERDDVSIYDLMGENERIKKQNEKFKAEVENLRELLAIEKKVTNGNYISNSKALAAAEVILKRGNSNYDKVKLAKEIKGVYEYIAEAEGSKYDALFRKCYEMADNVLREAKEEKVVDDYFKGILKDIRTTRISLDDMQKQEAKHLFGDHWNRNFMGKVIIADDGTSLDTMWQTWAGRYPDQFSADVNPNDQIGELYDIISTLQESSESVAEYDVEERRRWLAQEIFNTFWNIPTVETTADKYDKRIKELKAEHKKSIAKVREEYNERLDKQKMIDDMYYGRKMRDIYRNIRKRTDAEVAMAKAHGREMLEGYKERSEKKTKIQSITSIALRLNDMLVKNNKDKHIHEALKGPVANLINAINFSSKSLLEKGKATQKDISLQKALRQVSTMMHNAGTGQVDLIDLYGHGLDVDIERMVANVDDIVENLGGNEFVLQMMSLEDLKCLDMIMRDVRHAVIKVNEFHVVQHKAGVEALGWECEQELADRTKIYLDKDGNEDTNKHFDKLKTSLFWNNTTPYYAFKHFGKSSQKMFAAFQDAQDKMAFLSKEVVDESGKIYTAKEYKAWAKQYFDFTVLQPDGKTKKFSMNVPQIMSLYCVYKQDDAKRHIHADGESGGITLVETDKKAAVNTNIRLSPKDVQNIIGVLGNTAEVGRAKEVADKLQEFMGRRGAELGNEISMARWGIKSFGIENYFPIKVSAGTVEQKNETPGVEAHSLLALLNMSFTHSRNEYADQSVEIGDMFDIFANHMSDMIRYNAMAMPIIDMYKWMNIRGNDGFGKNHSIETSIKDAFGNHAWNYINTFMKDVNGSTKKSTRDKLAVRFFRNAKIAKVAGNIRVALLQFTSYIRAGAVMDNKYLLRALFHTPKVSKAKEHCGIALWKSLGYYDTDITRGLTEKIKHEDNVKDKIIELSLIGTEKADEITWGYLWNACELEVRETRKDLRIGSEEFYKEIGLRLRDVVYRTQVVDSMLTRSQLMRSTDSGDKILTTFASEGTLSLNLTMDVFVEQALDARSMGKKEAWKKNGKYIRKVVTAFVITNVVTSALQSVFDAFRDHYEDDKDEKYWAKLMLENFILNTSFLNKLPYFNTIISIFSGFSASRFDTDWASDASKMIKELTKFSDGKGSVEKVIRYALKTFSDASGIAAYNIYRDIYALYELFADND